MMLRDIRLPIVLAGSLALAAAPCVADTLVPQPRIIGGGAAGSGEYPFMAALVWSTSLGPLYSSDYQAHFCGGTVIAPRWILTAAHCVDEYASNQYQVITGVTTLADTPPYAARTAVSARLLHPQYDADTVSNDIALLYLATPVATTAGFSVDDGSTLGSLVDGNDLTAVGWGVVDQQVIGNPDDDVFSQVLQEVTLDYISAATCNGTYYGGQLADGGFCAGFLGGAARDTCYGDSGGPLLQPAGGGAWRQVGITSYGANTSCAVASEPGIYTDVGHYQDFVTGAQTLPDVGVRITAIPGSGTGDQAVARITVSNNSPLFAATATTLAISASGLLAITNGAAIAGCSGLATLTCNLGTLAAGSSTSRDVIVRISGAGTLNAATGNSAGDHFAGNDTAQRDYSNASPAAPLGATGGGGSLPPLLLPLLALLAYRRHAPHHPLRLR